MIALSQTGSFLRGLFILVVIAGFCAWAFWRMLKRSRDPVSLLTRCVLTAGLLIAAYFSIDQLAGDGTAGGQIAGVMVGLVFGLLLAFVWVPVVIGVVSDLFGNLFTGGTEPPPPEPHYSIADTRVKQGRYREAIYEIQRELEKFPDDIIGHIKLAEIQAQHLGDLQAAQVTLERFLHQPGRPAAHLAYALNTLADWQLKVQDVDAARASLERITLLLPDTEQANQAAQRLAHLATKEQLLAAHEHRPLPLRPGLTDVGLRQEASGVAPAAETQEAQAQRLVQHLEQHPLDNEAREQLAHLYADYYQRPDLAIAQLEQLIQAPHQPGKEVARWLNSMADLQLKHGADYETVRATLQRIIDRFQGLAGAELAHQRLEHLRLEFKGKQQSHVVQLGTYEKDLGLKGRLPKP